MERCVNIDWLEVYAIESNLGYPHNADFFRAAGWRVEEREYGTPSYREMFTLYSVEDDLPLLEIRRNPKSARGVQERGVLDPMGCHIRLCNRTCYFDNAAEVMQQFIDRYMFSCSRISRIDICLDFEKFDSGDDPQKFLNRYMNGKYSKINQARIGANGLDQWDGRYWNSLRWGQESSMVSTKFYDKTMELRERHDKPYIRQAWFASRLIDDWFTLEKYGKDGTKYKPRIWRVEFSIKSSTKNWFVVEDHYSTKKKLRSIRHTLDQYFTRAQLLDKFFSLADHYFHFKVYEDGQRKDRCKDKVLFKNCEPSTFYKVAHVATSKPQKKADGRLLQLLYKHRDESYKPEIFKACNVLIEQLEMRVRVADESQPMSSDELTLLRQLVAMRIKNHDRPIEEDVELLRSLMQVETDLFGELP